MFARDADPVKMIEQLNAQATVLEKERPNSYLSVMINYFLSQLLLKTGDNEAGAEVAVQCLA